MTAETGVLLGCDEPEFAIDWTRAAAICRHCEESLRTGGGSSEQAVLDNASARHHCDERFTWYQTRLAEAVKAKGIWFQTGASEADPSDDSYRSGAAVTFDDLTELADHAPWLPEGSKTSTSRDSDYARGYAFAVAQVLGIDLDQVHDWVEARRTEDGGR